MPWASWASTACWRTATAARTVPFAGGALLGAAGAAVPALELVLGAELPAWVAAPAPAALPEEEEDAPGVEAWADLLSSSCALRCEVLTAPRAFSMSWPSAPRLEAEPCPVAWPALPLSRRLRGHGVRLDGARDGRGQPARSPSRRCCCGAPGRARARRPRAAPRPPGRSDTDVRAAPLRAHSANRAQKLNAAICLGRVAPLRSMQEMSDSDRDQGPRRRPGRRRLRALTVVLLTCLAAAAAIAATRSHSSPRQSASRCIGATSVPEVKRVAPNEIGGLREDVARALPQRVGRLYEEGTVRSAVAWSDEDPAPPATSPHARRPAGYEMRWWAPNGDDVVADVLVFASEAPGAALPRARLERALPRAGGARRSRCIRRWRTTCRG